MSDDETDTVGAGVEAFLALLRDRIGNRTTKDLARSIGIARTTLSDSLRTGRGLTVERLVKILRQCDAELGIANKSADVVRPERPATFGGDSFR